MLVQWLLAGLMILAALAFSALVAFAIVSRRSGARETRRKGWMTNDMVRQIIDTGSLSGPQVPDQDLDLEEIAREEERFWSETWDEPEAHWE